jgi:thiamine pyrophosphate-dependent enzyme
VKVQRALDRREVVSTLLERREALLVVAGLGSPAWDCSAAGDHPLTFPMWGLGLALAQPARRILVVTGDGEMLMGIGSLATIAVQRPRNLSVVVLDNERYGETGMQKTHTAHGVDLAGIATACGFAQARRVSSAAELAPMRAAVLGEPGPLFFQVKVAADAGAPSLPPRDGAYLKQRFREALLAPRGSR